MNEFVLNVDVDTVFENEDYLLEIISLKIDRAWLDEVLYQIPMSHTKEYLESRLLKAEVIKYNAGSKWTVQSLTVTDLLPLNNKEAMVFVTAKHNKNI